MLPAERVVEGVARARQVRPRARQPCSGFTRRRRLLRLHYTDMQHALDGNRFRNSNIPTFQQATRVNVSFIVKGAAGHLIAVGSGDPTDPSSFTAPYRTSWRGKVQAIVQPVSTEAAGTVTVVASAEGLASGSATFETIAL